MRKFAQLERIDNHEAVTKENHDEFLHHLQQAMLLALRERGMLNVMQYRYADENLNRQRRDRAKKMLEKRGQPC